MTFFPRFHGPLVLSVHFCLRRFFSSFCLVEVFANVREDSTLSSARRAVRLLGKFCDLPSLADAAVSALETRPPRPPPPRRPLPPPAWGTAAAADTTTRVLASRYESSGGGGGGGRNGNSSRNDAVFRRRCLKWLRLRLPLAWVLNQAFLGRVPGCGRGGGAAVSAGSAAGAAAAGAAGAGVYGRKQGGGGGGGSGNGGREPEVTAAAKAAAAEEDDQEEEERFVGRGLAISTVRKMLPAAAEVAAHNNRRALSSNQKQCSCVARPTLGCNVRYSEMSSSFRFPPPSWRPTPRLADPPCTDPSLHYTEVCRGRGGISPVIQIVVHVACQQRAADHPRTLYAKATQLSVSLLHGRTVRSRSLWLRLRVRSAWLF